MVFQKEVRYGWNRRGGEGDGRLENMKKERKIENAGRGRDSRHGQTAKAGVLLFSGGTLTSHLSRLSVKRKEGKRKRTVEGFFSSLVRQT